MDNRENPAEIRQFPMSRRLLTVLWDMGPGATAAGPLFQRLFAPVSDYCECSLFGRGNRPPSFK